MIQQQSFLFDAHEPPLASFIDRAEANKQRGMSLAAERRAELVADGQVEFLRALLRSPDGTATVDDSTDDLSTKFAKGGKWRGSVPSGLARKRIIEPAAVVKSNRPSRHRGFVTVWRLVNHDKAQREVERLTTLLDATKKPLTVAPVAANESFNTQSTNNHGGNNHASK
jgi:hypothetical protein